MCTLDFNSDCSQIRRLSLWGLGILGRTCFGSVGALFRRHGCRGKIYAHETYSGREEDCFLGLSSIPIDSNSGFMGRFDSDK